MVKRAAVSGVALGQGEYAEEKRVWGGVPAHKAIALVPMREGRAEERGETLRGEEREGGRCWMILLCKKRGIGWDSKRKGVNGEV